MLTSYTPLGFTSFQAFCSFWNAADYLFNLQKMINLEGPLIIKNRVHLPIIWCFGIRIRSICSYLLPVTSEVNLKLISSHWFLWDSVLWLTKLKQLQLDFLPVLMGTSWAKWITDLLSCQFHQYNPIEGEESEMRIFQFWEQRCPRHPICNWDLYLSKSSWSEVSERSPLCSIFKVRKKSGWKFSFLESQCQTTW